MVCAKAPVESKRVPREERRDAHRRHISPHHLKSIVHTPQLKELGLLGCSSVSMGTDYQEGTRPPWIGIGES